MIKLNAIRFISQCTARGQLSPDEQHALVDAVLQDKSFVLALYSNFKHEPDTFVKHAKRRFAASSKQ